MKLSRISYHTKDDVNREAAAQAATECWASVNRSENTTAQPWRAFAAVRNDLDDVDAQFGRAIADELQPRTATFPSAGEGSGLVKEEVTERQADGVIMPRKFDRDPGHASDCEPMGSDAPTLETSACGLRGAPEDPIVLCSLVRSLATYAHATLHRGSVATSNDQPNEIGELRVRIQQLQEYLDRFRRHDRHSLNDLKRWLANLQQRADTLPAQPPRNAGE